MSSVVEYVVRVQGNFAFTYGLGEVVSSNVVLFKHGNYDLSAEELELAIKRTGSRKEAR